VLIGYMRVSKADGSQTLDLQRDALLAAGVEPGHLYEDQASGKRDNRPGLEACLKALRQGDTLVAWKLDRLGRDLRHLVNLVHDLTRRGADLMILAGQGAQLGGGGACFSGFQLLGFLAGRDSHDLDAHADHVGGALLPSGASGI
jgi:DNA invertase Pin-like site-specific DNA recombinase